MHSASEELHDYPAARRHLGHARTAIARLGGGAAEEASARLAYYEAVLAWREGKHDEAMARYDDAIARARGVVPELEINAMEAKGILHVELGQHAEALALHEEVLARRRALQGELHPDLAFALGNVATVHFHAGEHRRALEQAREATVSTSTSRRRSSESSASCPRRSRWPARPARCSRPRAGPGTWRSPP